MIRKADAVRFDGVVTSGRNEPLRVTAEAIDGEELEVFLKPSGRPELGIEGLANELLAACVAGHVGLPICEPVLVEMSPDWISSIPDRALQDVLRRSCPIAFASKSAGVGWKTWAGEDRLLGERRAAATAILAFDAFTENNDRRAQKPNLLVKGDAFRAIDHELCFRLRMQLFPPPRPWELGNLDRLTRPNGHLFGASLKGDRRVEVGPLRQPWASLSDESLSDYEAALPTQWQDAADPMEAALAHLRTIRDRIDDCLLELERVLA